MTYPIHDPLHQVSVLQQCLSGGKKKIGLFLGAGCPMAIPGENQEHLIPDIAGITKSVREQLTSCCELKAPYGLVEEQLKKDGISKPNVEHILTHIRALRAVAGTDMVRGLSAQQLDALDDKICDLIHQEVNKDLPSGRTPYHSVALWTDAIPRDFQVEIFTTNYDLLLEQALEDSRVPYFDGFSGVRRPIFNPRAIEEEKFLPKWTRLWKLHGSINWYQNENSEVFRGTASEAAVRRVIHPSHLKYQESRRMPYLAMIDRLRTFLNDSTAALVLCGYSFRDDHINDTIIQGLQHTQTSVAFALAFGPLVHSPEVTSLAKSRPNLNVLAKDGGVIGGQQFDWPRREYQPVPAIEDSPVSWDQINPTEENGEQRAQLNLGDFRVFGRFLQSLVGDGMWPTEVSSNGS